MYVQPNKYQPSFNGKIRCVNCIGSHNGMINSSKKTAKNKVIDLPSNTWNKLNQIVENKDYDIFIHPNLNNEEFFNIDAGKTFNDVLKGIQGKVKVKFDALEALPLAIKDAMKNFEESFAEAKTKITTKESM